MTPSSFDPLNSVVVMQVLVANTFSFQISSQMHQKPRNAITATPAVNSTTHLTMTLIGFNSSSTIRQSQIRTETRTSSFLRQLGGVIQLLSKSYACERNDHYKSLSRMQQASVHSRSVLFEVIVNLRR